MTGADRYIYKYIIHAHFLCVYEPCADLLYKPGGAAQSFITVQVSQRHDVQQLHEVDDGTRHLHSRRKETRFLCSYDRTTEVVPLGARIKTPTSLWRMSSASWMRMAMLLGEKKVCNKKEIAFFLVSYGARKLERLLKDSFVQRSRIN